MDKDPLESMPEELLITRKQQRDLRASKGRGRGRGRGTLIHESI